jgi:hypothetical protein
VGEERTHPELFRECERVTVEAVSLPRRLAASGDLAEEPEGPGFVGALTALASKRQCSRGEFESILEPTVEKVRFAHIRQEERAESAEAHGLSRVQRMLQQRDALSNPPRERVGVAQDPREVR